MNDQHPQLQLALQDFRNSDDYVDMVFHRDVAYAGDWLKFSGYEDLSHHHFMAAVKTIYMN